MFACGGEGVPTGSARPPSPRAPAPPAPAARQLCAPVGPGGHRQTAGSAAGSPAGPCSVRHGAPRKGKGGRRGYQALVGSNSAWQALAGRPEPWLSPAAPAPSLGPWPAAPSGPRLAWAPGRRRAGAAGQDTALLAPGAAGAPGRPQNPGNWSGAPLPRPGPSETGRAGRSRRGHGAQSSGPEFRPGSRGTGWPFAGSGEGVPLFATPSKAPLQPGSVPTHPRAHTLPGAGRVAHLSPKSC